jgi:hypothetical protein
MLSKAQGEFIAWFFIIVVLLAAACFFLVLNKVWGSISEPLDEGLAASLDGHDTSSVNVSKVIDQTGEGARSFDKLIPFLIIGLFGFVLILAGGIMRHPIMIFVGLIVMGVVIILAVIYSNLYFDIASSDSFASTSDDLPIQNKFMEFLPFIVFIAAIGIGVAIIWRRTEGGGGTL